MLMTRIVTFIRSAGEGKKKLDLLHSFKSPPSKQISSAKADYIFIVGKGPQNEM